MRIGQFLPELLVFGALSAFFSPPAFAETPVAGAPAPLAETLTGDAKQDYEAGKHLYESGDYAGALSKFQSAAQASGDPRLFWDAAVCQRAMNHYAGAIALVHRYLDSHSPLIAPEATRKAQDFLGAAEARTARLDVQSSEPGALVSVDGEAQGAVPLAADARIDLGTHRLTVSKDGFVDYATPLTVETTADVHVTAVLAPMASSVALSVAPSSPSPEGRLVVRAGSRDTIAVDGTPLGVGTWTGTLAPGPHSVRVTEPDSIPSESEVVVEEHQTRSVDVALRPARHAARVPMWLWVAGSAVLAAGAVTAGYFIFKPSEPAAANPTMGSIGTATLP
jgi:hypothetical protein